MSERRNIRKVVRSKNSLARSLAQLTSLAKTPAGKKTWAFSTVSMAFMFSSKFTQDRYTPCDESVPWSAAMVIKSASSVLTTRLPWPGQVLSHISNMSLVSSAPHFRSSSASTAVSMPLAPPKTITACEKLGSEAVTVGDRGVPLSDVPMVRSYPFYKYKHNLQHVSSHSHCARVTGTKR